jgi:recombination protein RecA
MADRIEAAVRGKQEAVAEEMMTGPDADDDAGEE